MSYLEMVLLLMKILQDLEEQAENVRLSLDYLWKKCSDEDQEAVRRKLGRDHVAEILQGVRT
jgi:hypothetical protein